MTIESDYQGSYDQMRGMRVYFWSLILSQSIIIEALEIPKGKLYLCSHLSITTCER